MKASDKVFLRQNFSMNVSSLVFATSIAPSFFTKSVLLRVKWMLWVFCSIDLSHQNPLVTWETTENLERAPEDTSVVVQDVWYHPPPITKQKQLKHQIHLLVSELYTQVVTFLQLNNNWVTQSKTAHPPGSQLFPWRGSCSQGWYSHPGVYRRLVSTTFSLLSPQGGYSWGGCRSFPETSLLPAQCWNGDHHIDGQEEEELEAAQLTCKWKR